jgi:phenylalanyl-tRNA synthetase beta chain
LDQKISALPLFELGRAHFLEDGSLQEPLLLSILLTGYASPPHWSQKKPRLFDYYDLKGYLEAFFLHMALPFLHVQPANHPHFHPHIQAKIQDDKSEQILGSLGQLHPDLVESFGLSVPVFFAELDLEALIPLQNNRCTISPLPLYPSSTRDWTVAVLPSYHVGNLVTALYARAPSILESIDVLDLFESPELKTRQVTFRFTYRDLSKTLSFEEVEVAHHLLLDQVKSLL